MSLIFETLHLYLTRTPSRSLGTFEEVVGNYGGSLCEPESEPVRGKEK